MVGSHLIPIMAYISLTITRGSFGCEDNLLEIMCPKSFGDVRFDLGALLVGRMWSLIPIMVYISLIIGRRGLDVKTTYGESCAPNFLVGSYFTFDPSFKVKRGP